MQKVRKSDRTRAAILDAAQKLFAEHGHERTTVRDIAAKASVDPALVIRYFGSKDELFVRAAAFDLKVPDLDKINRSQIGETSDPALPRAGGGLYWHDGPAPIGSLERIRR